MIIMTCLAHDLFCHGDECLLSTDTPEGNPYRLHAGDMFYVHVQLNNLGCFIVKLLYSILHHVI